MKMYNHNDLLNFTTKVFMQIGCSREDAAAVAAVLVAAELRDHSSHGMIRI
ncbi:Ldh family oxidoreductase, partial [bacterium]|nr:Ldh family oxidoreductase [bacterium]